MASRRPAWVPAKYHDHWDRPWTTKARRSAGFRRLLAAHHLLTPHFSYAEAMSKDGRHIPKALRGGARSFAFKLELLRHKLGDVAIPITSWYRSPQRNRQAGGAKFSKHLLAIAADIPVEFVRRHANFDRLVDEVFRDGGFGQYPGGARHVDSRPGRARWTSFRPGR